MDTKRVLSASAVALIFGGGLFLANQQVPTPITKEAYSEKGFAGKLNQLVDYVWKTAKQFKEE